MARTYAQLLIKIPSRERPGQLQRLVQELDRLCERPSDTSILITADEDQRSTYEPLLKSFKALRIPVRMLFGTRRTKIEAVNRDLHRSSGWDIVAVVSDDMKPVVVGYDQVIRKYMRTHFPKGDGCLWFHDGYQDRVCTMPVMDRIYYDRDLNIYDPRFDSYYADDAQTELALARGRMRKIGECLFRHEHCCWNSSVPNDALYRHNRSAKERDRLLYQVIRRGYP
jgi:hypothetical protein